MSSKVYSLSKGSDLSHPLFFSNLKKCYDRMMLRNRESNSSFVPPSYVTVSRSVKQTGMYKLTAVSFMSGDVVPLWTIKQHTVF